MDRLGIIIDDERNEKARGSEALISSDDSQIKVYMIPTNEELEIAKQTIEVVEKC